MIDREMRRAALLALRSSKDRSTDMSSYGAVGFGLDRVAREGWREKGIRRACGEDGVKVRVSNEGDTVKSGSTP